MIRWKLLIANIILLIASGYLCFFLIDLIKTPYNFDKIKIDRENQTNPKIVNVPQLSGKNKPNLVFFKDIVEKELFRPDRKELVEEKESEKNVEDEEIEQPNFIVLGITVFGESYKAAIIEKRPGKKNQTKPHSRRSKPLTQDNTRIPPKIYKEGDEIDSSWIVKNIYSRRVEFCHGERCFFESLYKTYEDKDYIPPRTPDRSTTTSRKVSPRSKSQQKSADFTAEEFKRLIQQGGGKKP